MRSGSPSSVPPPLPELESEVMEEIWLHGQATVRAVLEALNARSGKQRAYTTIMTVMRRLDDKGLVMRHRERRTDVYLPALSREQYLEARTSAEVGALVDEYGDRALVHFVQRIGDLDPARQAQLRRLARRIESSGAD